MAGESLAGLAASALSEILEVFTRAEESELNPLGVMLKEIVQARHGQIVLYGVGREGLMMKALAMRLFHLGLNSHFVGDMGAPAIGPDDLFIASAGPGSFSTVDALMGVANRGGARVLLVSAQQQAIASSLAHAVAILPGRTMANDVAGNAGLLPMGSVYEGALFVMFEILVTKLRDELGETKETMRARHTNME